MRVCVYSLSPQHYASLWWPRHALCVPCKLLSGVVAGRALISAAVWVLVCNCKMQMLRGRVSWYLMTFGRIWKKENGKLVMRDEQKCRTSLDFYLIMNFMKCPKESGAQSHSAD